MRVDQLLADVKAYIKRKPLKFDYNQFNVENIGFRLVQQNQQKYIGEKIATWTRKLKPRPLTAWSHSRLRSNRRVPTC